MHQCHNGKLHLSVNSKKKLSVKEVLQPKSAINRLLVPLWEAKTSWIWRCLAKGMETPRALRGRHPSRPSLMAVVPVV
jgi:hypothetical protein